MSGFQWHGKTLCGRFKEAAPYELPRKECRDNRNDDCQRETTVRSQGFRAPVEEQQLDYRVMEEINIVREGVMTG